MDESCSEASKRRLVLGNVNETSHRFDIKSPLDQTPSPSARAQLRCEGTIRRKNYGSIRMLSSRGHANSAPGNESARTFDGSIATMRLWKAALEHETDA